MNEIICPLCGNQNDSNAESCEVCKVQFNQLPSELNPARRIASEPEDSEPPTENDTSGIPAWLLKRMSTNQKNNGAASFDNYMDAIFGQSKGMEEDGGSSTDPVTTPGLFSDEDLSALEISNRNEQETSGLSQEEQKYRDFSHFRPEKKWDDPLPSAAKASDLSEDEKQYEDFSVIRPEKKWEDRPIYLPADVERSSAQSALEEPDVVTGSGSFLDAKSDDQLALFDTGEANRQSSPTDFESIGIAEDELPYVDFSVNRPARKWDDTEESNPSYNERTEASDQLLSVKNESLQPDAGEDETADNSEGSGSLVDAFLSKIEASPTNVAALPDTEDPSVNTENDESWSVEYGEPEVEADAALESILNDSQPSYVQASEPNSEASESPIVFEDLPDDLIPEELLQDDITPGNGVAEDNLDEVPWNLFESGEMSFPGAVPQTESRVFPKSEPAEKAVHQDYQQRMIFSILERIFQIEGLNPPLRTTKNRGTSKAGQLILSLVLIAGICLILFTGITDRIQLKKPTLESFPSLMQFNQALAALDEETRALIIIDYNPGYRSELFQPTEKLIQKLSDKKTHLDLITANALSVALLTELAERAPENASLNLLGFQPGDLLAAPLLLNQTESDYQNVYLITADFESARGWAEQLTLWGKVPVHGIASARLEALLVPYHESGMVTSLISRKLEKDLFAGVSFDNSSDNRRLFALWFLIGFVILSVIAGNLQRNPYQSILIESEKNSADTKKSRRTETNLETATEIVKEATEMGEAE